MPLIPLDRRFFEWRNTDDELSDPDLLGRFGLSEGARTWADLLKRRRVVILAEAGSGKTEELKEQARRLSADGKYVFYATVQDVGRDGLDGALGDPSRAAMAAWRASDQPAWFFIDSIDEAKLDGIRLERAFRQIASGIAGAEGRAHIVLSGRHTDWQFRRDLARLQELLPVPTDRAPPSAPTPDQLLIRILRHERNDETASDPEAPLVVILASLDATRVRLFAVAKQAPNVDALLAEIDARNLWRFARRPLDLDWLVQFWKTNQRLGTLAEMLAVSLRKRLRETDPDRSRRDPLDAGRAVEALERLGAALVFGRVITLAIPDAEIVLSAGPPAFDLAAVLPDWSGIDRTRLLNRPVFDPATFGRVRLHNDNEGVVRAYLAARWLDRLHKANLSREGLFALLFADTYGQQIVKPSLQETAAWLSLWNPDVAREVIHREPYLLLTAGDPASLSVDIRVGVLTRLVERTVANDENLPILDYDSVKRFSRPDIAPTICQLWTVHKNHAEARDLLLRLVWLGEIRECADLAAEAAANALSSRHDQIVAGRALMATADDGAKRQYAARVVTECASLPPAVVWDAVEALFPPILGVGDLLTILGRVNVADRDGGVGFQWQSPDLIKRVNSPRDLEQLLSGLTALLGEETGSLDMEPDDRQETLLTAIAAIAHRLLALSAPDMAPPSAIDAAFRVARQTRHGASNLLERTGDAGAELRKFPARRRQAFWRAAERLTGHPLLQGRPLEHTWEMEFLGWTPKLAVDDLDWLLTDAPTRPLASERRLAINAALSVWRDAGRADDLLERISTVARAETAMAQTLDLWLHPPPMDAGLAQQHRELERLRDQNARRRAEGDQSWIYLVARLRADPDQLRHLNPATAEGIDGRLFHLWQFLNSAMQSRNRYAIESVAPVEPVLGPEVAAALRDGLIRHWRTWEPTRESTRAPGDRNRMSSVDAMGIAGVTMDAQGNPQWANRIDAALARRAAGYATLELNGLPGWIADLSARWPNDVRDVLLQEILAEIDTPEARHGMLSDVRRADPATVGVMIPPLLDELTRRPELRAAALEPLLEIVEQATEPAARSRLAVLAIERFSRATETEAATLYIGTAFRVDPALATDALMQRIDSLDPPEQTRLAQRVLPHIFGGRFSRGRAAPRLPFQRLVRLVRLAFQTIRVEDDNDHPSGVVYTPDLRDDAEGARSAAFNQLNETPGLATFNALLAFAEVPDFPVTPPRLRQLARNRAALDSESAPWPPDEAGAFEEQCESLPRTPLDLQRLMLGRLSDLQHALLHDDFAQGSTLCGLPDETAVQNWTAHALRTVQGRSYSVERESHVVDENEPDIRARSGPDVSVAIEIKVAESWTLEQLESALVDQLCGRYLRAKGARYGILLLVHQHTRPLGWTNPRNRRHMTFAEVVEHLRVMARRIAGADPDAPQPEIAVIDVSSCVASRPATMRKNKKGKSARRNRPAARRARACRPTQA